MGVDSLYLGACVNIPPQVYDKLEEAHGNAQRLDDGTAGDTASDSTFDLGGETFIVKAYGRQGFRYVLGNGRWTLAVPSRGDPLEERTVMLEIRAATLWNDGYRECVAAARRLFARLHESETPSRVWITRVDPCVDMIGFPLLEDERRNFVTRAHKRAQFWPNGSAVFYATGAAIAARLAKLGHVLTPELVEALDDDPVEAEISEGKARSSFGVGLDFTGYVYGRGDVVIRMYDKTAEIRERSPEKVWFGDVWAKSNTAERERVRLLDEAAKATTAAESRVLEAKAEELRAKAAEGYMHEKQVVRVEAQFRRNFLRQLKLVDTTTGRLLVVDENGEDLGDMEPEAILDNLVSLWRYAVGVPGMTGELGGWLSWRESTPRQPQRTRWPVRSEWEVVRSASFDGRGYGVVRERRRRFEVGENLAQMRGLAATVGACIGKRGLVDVLEHSTAELDRIERVAAERAELEGRDYPGFATLVEQREYMRELAEFRKSLFDFPRRGPPRGGGGP